MTTERYIHIVCLDVPYPVDYGGVFDLFYKLLYLKEQGVKIILHCFQYGRNKQPILENYCERVYYYHRKRGIRSISLTVPYIVQSRNDSRLLKNLAQDNYPVLMEGTHCTLLLWKNRLLNRKVILRLHNIEADYYRHLAQNEKSFFKKLYYRFESKLLNKYEPEVINNANLVLPVSEKDCSLLQTERKLSNVKMIPVFTNWNEVHVQEGKGKYCLYHGNLGVVENEVVAFWLIEKVFSNLDLPLKIAGKNPSATLCKAASLFSNIEIIANPGENEMEELIGNAQINLLPSLSSTGIKLKLLHAVFRSRHCIANRAMAEGTHLEEICILVENANAFKESVHQKFHQPVTQEMINLRSQILDQYYNNRKNILELIDLIWNNKRQS